MDLRHGRPGRFPLLRGLVSCALLLASGLAACAGKRADREPITAGDRLARAVTAFEEEDYGDARSALREFLVEHPLHPHADSAQYLLGQASFRDGKYVEAADAYSRLARNRPTSAFADDAQLGACRSYLRLSPDLPLDQEYTRKAVEACDRLLRYYTPSPLEEEARKLRKRARDKLAAKQYRTARWYYDQGIYESANIYLEDILQNYPSAPVVPETLLTLYRSYRTLGFQAEAEEMRRRLLEEHGDSDAARRLADEGSSGGPGPGKRPR